MGRRLTSHESWWGGPAAVSRSGEPRVLRTIPTSIGSFDDLIPSWRAVIVTLQRNQAQGSSQVQFEIFLFQKIKSWTNWAETITSSLFIFVGSGMSPRGHTRLVCSGESHSSTAALPPFLCLLCPLLWALLGEFLLWDEVCYWHSAGMCWRRRTLSPRSPRSWPDSRTSGRVLRRSSPREQQHHFYTKLTKKVNIPEIFPLNFHTSSANFSC